MARTRSKSGQKKKYVQCTTELNQYRNNIAYLVEVYGNISEKLKEDHKKLMQDTPFKLFFKAIEEKRICGNTRNDKVLDHIITLYNPEQKAFRIGSGYCKFRRSDIKLIFGIIDGPLKVDNSHGKKIKSDFAARVFPNIERITAKMMKNKLVELVDSEDKTAVVDTVRVLCLLMFQSCFFTNTGQTIAWTYVKYVEDLETLKCYDWSSVIYERLIRSLEVKSQTPRKVVGCNTSLLYWLCEHDKALNPRQEENPMKQQNQEDVASLERTGIPRCTKWDLTILNIFVNMPKIMAIPKQSVIWTELDPTPAELQLIPDLVKNPTGQRMQELHDSDVEDDIPLVTGNASKNRRFDDEGYIQYEEMHEQDENDAQQTEQNAYSMHDPFEGNVQAISELEKKERELSDKAIKERDDKIEHLEAKVEKLKKRLRKSEARNKDLAEGKTKKLDEVEADVDDVNRMTSDTIQNLELQQKEDEIRKQKEHIRIHEKNALYMHQVKEDLLGKLKILEEEKGSIIAQLKSTVTELQVMKQYYESKIEEQGTKIEALQKLQEEDMLEKVHAVTQQYAEKEKDVKENSRIRGIKARKRNTRKDDGFVYPEEKKIRTEHVDLTNESAAEGAKTRSKTVKVSLRSKKGDYPCGEKINEEAFELLQTTLSQHGRLGVLWSDDNGNTITLHDMVNLLEGRFIADKVIDAFATMLSRNGLVRDRCHILPAATWVWCKRYAEDGNYSNQFVNNMKEHVVAGKNILIPLCCPGTKNEPYHWILVNFDSGEKGEWYMYNSISSRKGVADPFEKDVVAVQEYIWKCFPSSNPKLKLKELKKFGNIPLQGSDTNDCAIYVMYYMYQIARNQLIDKKWKADEVQGFKAFIVNSIVSNQMNIEV